MAKSTKVEGWPETKQPLLSPDQLWERVVLLAGEGLNVDHHESDLYIPATPETSKLVRSYRFRDGCTTFNSDGELWYSIPFGYKPFWDARNKAVETPLSDQ